MSYSVRACSTFTRFGMAQIQVRPMSVQRMEQKIVIYRPEITELAREAMALNSKQIDEMDQLALRRHCEALEKYDDILWRHKNIFSSAIAGEYESGNRFDKETHARFEQERDNTEAIRVHVRKKQQEIKDRLPDDRCCIL